MIIDRLANASLYAHLNSHFAAAFNYLQSAAFSTVAPGRYEIEGDKVFAIVQEYETADAANEQMESHRKYIDVQYVISGEEMVGLALYNNQTCSKTYDADADFMLYADKPDFFAPLKAGMFMIFFPTDLHMPCINVGDIPAKVKKVVVKVAVS